MAAESALAELLRLNEELLAALKAESLRQKETNARAYEAPVDAFL